MDLPDKFVVKTDFGLFQIKITNRDYITIGTGNDCVQIAYDVNKNTATLDWLSTEKGGCEETDKPIHGKDTTAMIDLGLTILRQLYPSVNPTAYLIDSSAFTCLLPDGSKFRISNTIYNLLTKGKTYYQDRLNAVPRNDEYKDTVSNYQKAWATEPVPEDFDFVNPDIARILEPLRSESNTWKEFLEAIYKKYGRNTCTIIAPWHLQAHSELMRHGYIPPNWKFDLTLRPMIPYEITNVRVKSGTRKNNVYNPYIWGGGVEKFTNFRHMNYKKYRFKNTKTRRIPK